MNDTTKDNYVINVSISIEKKGEHHEEFEPKKNSNGDFSLVISQNEAESIDHIEKAVLKTSFPAIRDAVSNHLTDLSLQKALIVKNENDILEINEKQYRIDGEIGRFCFNTHRILRSNKEYFNTRKECFPTLKGKELYKTIGFKEIAIVDGVTQSSYRKTRQRINRMRYQESEAGTPLRTLQNIAELEGKKLQKWIDERTNEILSENEHIIKKQPIENLPENEIMLLPKEKVQKAINECEAQLKERGIIEGVCLNENKLPYEHPEYTINISDDDVKVKRQKEERRSEAEKNSNEVKKKKYLLDTLVHVEKLGKKYILTGYGIKNVLKILIAFLLNSNELGSRFQFFTDGHDVLNKAINDCFSWYKNKAIILDWYHLSKKCKERLSMGLKGRDIRNEVLRQIMPLLWNGLTDQAIIYLQNIKVELVKNTIHINKLIDYLERNKCYIPCYSVRKKLGLRNSSNIGEKMNDLIISERQKHNGMSWSKDGSLSLAGLTSLIRNNESKRWFADDYLEFKLAA